MVSVTGLPRGTLVLARPVAEADSQLLLFLGVPRMGCMRVTFDPVSNFTLALTNRPLGLITSA